MRTIRRGTWAEIADIRDRDAIYRLIDRPFAFKIAGAEFSPQAQAKVWDGRVHLVRKIRGGGLEFPAGLYPEILDILRSNGYAPEIEEVDERLPAQDIGPVDWRGPVLRDYQAAAALAALDRGGGTILLPIRAGKTITAARMIDVLGVRSLFVVPSDLLVRQSADVFRETLGNVEVSIVGGGDWDVSGDVVVATIQTLASRLRTREFARFSRSFGAVFLDEVHHLQNDGDAWRDAALALDARHKFGLSATVAADPKGENDPGAVWIRGICGPVVYSVGMSLLIERGFLVRPTIRFVSHGAPELPSGKIHHARLYREGIVECGPRNARLAAEAVAYARAGRGVLVDASRVPHVRILLDLISRGLPPGTAAALTGDSSAEERDAVLQAFRARRVLVIVGTILGEGIDVPEIDVVVNAEGGRAKVSTVQRMRNLTPAPGKTEAIVVEPIDVHHPRFREWTLERLRIYRKEPAFRFEIEGMDGAQAGG